MAARGRFYNVDPTPDNLRAIWGEIHRLGSDLQSAQSTITAQQILLTQQQAALDKAAKNAAQALNGVLAQAAVTAAVGTGTGSGGGGGTPPPVDSIVVPNHAADVQIAWNANAPMIPTVEWAFRVVRLLSWTFRNEVIDGVPFAMGLLMKTAGDNIYTCGGQNYSAGRVCYPSGHIFKILTDVPTTNGPEWADDGYVDAAQYHVAINPATPC
jgi:hypothetical protein